MKGENKVMDNIDKLIQDSLKQNIEVPLSCKNTILYTLQKKKIVKKYKLFKFMKSLCTACLSILFSTSVVFASYTVYEKVWKEPKIYNSLEEKIEYDKEIIEKDNKERVEKSEIISVEKAISNSLNIFKKLEIEQEITTENVKINSEKFFNYFEIETNEYIMELTPNGNFCYLINKRYDYNAKDDSIDENTALELSKKIINSLNFNKQYSLNFIEYTNGFINNNSYDIWMASYYETINGIKNKYNCINIFFSIIDNNLVIERISNLNDNYEFQNNEIIITEEQAIKIAKSADRKISILDITTVDAELDIERLNAFVYVQIETLGKEDEIKSEVVNDNTNYYYGYTNEKIIRNIWKVKIDYNYSSDKARNKNEYLGRYYYIDATTGEIIGGSWGKIGY